MEEYRQGDQGVDEDRRRVTRPHYNDLAVVAEDEATCLPPRKWLTYEQAADYTGWSVRYLRNLVSADQIPVYGQPRSRRFRLDMLDHYVTNRDAAMRRFRLERNTHHGH